MHFIKATGGAILLAIISVSTIAAQDVRVQLGKRAAAIPKICESVVPASIEGQVDIPALVKEAACKGAGDMLGEYTYVMKFAKREKDKKGRIKEETITYDVFVPTLKSGTNTRGVLVVTSRNGVPVPPVELEKEQLRAGERLEKEESKIAQQNIPPPQANSTSGMLPLGMYTRMGINREIFGIRRGGAALSVDDFLKACELTFLRRQQHEGREMLVFSFVPRSNILLNENVKYISQLRGEIWIDALDRIVTRLAGWPLEPKAINQALAASSPGEKPPAVYTEMIRLPEGVWLPCVARINGLDYPKLFDGVSDDSTFTYSQFQRFKTEIQDVKIKDIKQEIK